MGRFQILGDDIQMVEVTLEPGEGLRSEAGAMLYMDAHIEMEAQVGGLFKGLKRMLAGESLALTTYTNRGRQPGRVAFAAPYPGKIIPLNLSEVGGEFLVQRGSYLASTVDVDIEIAFTKRLGAGLFGGEGFLLQRLKGRGLAFLHAGGHLVEKELAAGETLLVDTGCIVGFVPTVTYDIRLVKGIKTIFLGGEGLFLATLTGPGKVLLQSLPLSTMARTLVMAAGITKSS